MMTQLIYYTPRDRILPRGFFFPLHRNGQQNGGFRQGCEVVCLEEQKEKQELIGCLRKLVKWKNNDVVKLAFLGPEEAERVDKLDLSGVVELKRNANGTFEAKFVDKVRVLAMLRELMDERRDGELGDFLDGLYGGGDGGEG